MKADVERWRGQFLGMAGAVLFTLALDEASAKCASVPYRVDGTIVSSAGQSIADAVIELQWDQLATASAKRIFVRSDAAGVFSAAVDFYPWQTTSWWSWDCRATLKSVHIRTSAAGFEPSVRDVTFDELHVARMVVTLRKAHE